MEGKTARAVASVRRIGIICFLSPCNRAGLGFSVSQVVVTVWKRPEFIELLLFLHKTSDRKEFLLSYSTTVLRGFVQRAGNSAGIRLLTCAYGRMYTYGYRIIVR